MLIHTLKSEVEKLEHETEEFKEQRRITRQKIGRRERKAQALSQATKLEELKAHFDINLIGTDHQREFG